MHRKTRGIEWHRLRRASSCRSLLFLYVCQKTKPICFSYGRFFSIAEKGHMHIIKLSFKHIAALPTHHSKKSCMNFDQAIVFF